MAKIFPQVGGDTTYASVVRGLWTHLLPWANRNTHVYRKQLLLWDNWRLNEQLLNNNQEKETEQRTLGSYRNSLLEKLVSAIVSVLLPLPSEFPATLSAAFYFQTRGTSRDNSVSPHAPGIPAGSCSNPASQCPTNPKCPFSSNWLLGSHRSSLETAGISPGWEVPMSTIIYFPSISFYSSALADLQGCCSAFPHTSSEPISGLKKGSEQDHQGIITCT